MERAVAFRSVRRCSLGQRVIAAVWFALALVVFPNIAGAFSVFGPETFTRSKGKPVTEIRNFSVQDPAADATLSIQVSQVSSAVITLNGVQIFGPSDFNQTVTFLESAVTLLADNELAVELRGKPGGTLTIEVTTSGPPISVGIVSPASGTTIDSDRISVTGTFEGPANTGVTVNGVVAAIFNNQFFATVPLVPGANILTATATTPDGATVSDAITVTSTATGTEPDSVQVVASPQSGIAPLTVEFTVLNSTRSALQDIAADFDGDGNIDFTTTDPSAPIQFIYTVPGVLVAELVVTDATGTAHTMPLVIQVFTVSEIDALVQEIWRTITTNLASGNIEGALTAFSPEARERYRPVLQNIASELPSMFTNFPPIHATKIADGEAEYFFVFPEAGTDFGYFMYFVRGPDGVWRLQAL